MDFVETEGDSIDAAIDRALKTLGVARDKISVEIIAEGRKGILGFGAKKAKIRASLRKLSLEVDAPVTRSQPAPAKPRAPEPSLRVPERKPAAPRVAPPPRVAESRPVPPRTQAPAPRAQIAQPTPPVGQVPLISPEEAAAMASKAKSALGEILNLMGLKATVEQKASPDGDEAILEIKTDNSGLIIGRKGQTLEALQYLVSRIAGERPGSEGSHIVIDIENYHERRRRSLQDMALRMGEKAKRQRKTVTIDALSAADRKIVHAALQDDPWLTTRSLGQGSFRRLLIIPEGDRKIKEGANAPMADRDASRPPRGPNPTRPPENES